MRLESNSLKLQVQVIAVLGAGNAITATTSTDNNGTLTTKGNDVSMVLMTGVPIH